MEMLDASGGSTDPITPLPISLPKDQPDSMVAPIEPPLAQSVTVADSKSAPLESLISFRETAAELPASMTDELNKWLDGSNADNINQASSTPVQSPGSYQVNDREPVNVQRERGTVVGDLSVDYANRYGSAKQRALMQTGGSIETEAAVELAIRFLASGQRRDGAWDPQSSGAGVERAPLGMSRGGAGSKAETAITGLAVLTLLGAGNTHQQGAYADNVYRGLAYLIGSQKPDGSLAGSASVYEATYCHGMAALAMCEAAAMTGDASAMESARRAVAFTTRNQHPSTGGWRYLPGDPGDLSQLGWQAMVLDGARRAGISVDNKHFTGVERFLTSVRAGTEGGLACYRTGEAPSRTMTAEAMSTRLLIGMPTKPGQIAEAEQSMLQQLPGVGQDNYYYWYYATLALHQLQDDSWQVWNTALKRRLLETQQPDGSWPTDSVWGGYGGRVYTTSMATLCLESYYRHALRDLKP
jgi:hypothetical protein